MNPAGRLRGGISSPALPIRATAGARLFPTPTVVDMGRRKSPDEWRAWCQVMRERHGNGNGHGASLHQVVIERVGGRV